MIQTNLQDRKDSQIWGVKAVVFNQGAHNLIGVCVCVCVCVYLYMYTDFRGVPKQGLFEQNQCSNPELQCVLS